MNSTPRFSRTQAGLTLIELMITVAIVAILIGISVPSFAKLGASQRMSAASHTVMASFNQARMRALATASQVVLCPSIDGQTCTGGLSWEKGWIIYDDANRNRKLDPTETVAATFELPEGLTASTTIGRPQLMFKPDGGAWGNPLTLTICDATGTETEGRAIVVSNAGRPRTAEAASGSCGA